MDSVAASNMGGVPGTDRPGDYRSAGHPDRRAFFEDGDRIGDVRTRPRDVHVDGGGNAGTPECGPEGSWRAPGRNDQNGLAVQNAKTRCSRPAIWRQQEQEISFRHVYYASR